MYYRQLSIIFFLLFGSLFGQAETEFTLKNGMKVVLKPTSFDEQELFVRVSALKGYVNLPEKLRPAAESLHEIIWESGIGSLTGDQLSVVLFEEGLDIDFKIGPTERFIEGEGRVDSAPMLFELIKELFVLSKIDATQLPVVRERLKEDVISISCDKSCQFDSLFYQINTEGYARLAPLTTDSIDQITLEDAQKVLMAAFQNPAEFTAIVTGDIDVVKMKALIEKTLGTIPKGRDNSIWEQAPALTFPKGTTRKQLFQAEAKDSLTRITFPILATINESNIRVLDLMTETIEARLRTQLQKRYGEMFGIDVSYEFLLYPLMDKPWITLQFRSNHDKSEAITQFIIQQLTDLQTNGPTQEDVVAAKLLKEQSDEYWNQDNHFWISVLSQYHMMGWEKGEIVKNYGPNDVSLNQITQAIKTYIPLDNYTVVSGGN